MDWNQFFKLGRKMFAIARPNDVRIHGLVLIQKLIANMPKENTEFDQFDPEQEMVVKLLNELSKTSQPLASLKKEINFTLGLFCEKFPSKITSRIRIKNYFLSQLKEQKNSTSNQVDNTILEGCFKGLEKYLISFPFEFPKEKVEWDYVYDFLSEPAMSQFSNEEIGKKRRMHKRAALNLFASHSKMWGPKLVLFSECKYWYLSLKEWSESTNSDDSKLAWKCLESFLKTLAVEFKRNQDAHQETFQYLLKTFTAVIKNSATVSKVIHSRPEN